MRKVALFLVLCICLGCAKTTVKPAPAKAPAPEPGKRAERPETSRAIPSSIVIYDLAKDEWSVNDRDRASMDFLPASTFKILHTLIALQSSVVSKDEVFKWDGTKYNYAKWNQDHTLESAFRHSAIWVYQRIAKRIGEERMRNYIALAGYGNGNIGGNIDSFWLDGELRVTSRQQIGFLVQLYKGSLPFSTSHMEYVKKLMVRDRGNGWVLRAKSGWAQRVDPQIGWLVGWVEKDRNAWFFATNVEIRDRKDAARRYGLTMEMLREMEVIPERETAKK